MDSVEQIFLKEVEKYPVLSNQEQLELLNNYRETGNEQVHQKIIHHNLRLCIFIAKKYIQQVQSMSFMDLVQENVITLIKAIDLYNPNKKVKLSTYIIRAMENNILRMIDNTDKIVRKPVHIESLTTKYKQFLRSFEQNYNRKPTNEEIQEQLKITKDQLQNLEHSLKMEVSSLDKKVSSDKDSSSLINFIPFRDNNYDNVENQYDLTILKGKCRKILTEEEYYIIYYRYITEYRKTLAEIANEFCLKGESIRQKEFRALQKLKERLKSQNSNYKDNQQLDPLSISQIIILFELKEKLSKEEYFILYSMIQSKEVKNDNYYSKLLGITITNVQEIKEYLMDIFNQYNEERFLDELSKKYRQRYTIAQILNLDIEINCNDLIDFRTLEEYFKNLRFNDIEETDYYKSLSKRDQKLIEKYYTRNREKLNSYQIEQIERELLLNYLGYLSKEKSLYNWNQFRELYKKYNNLLNEKQKENLRIILFPKQGDPKIKEIQKQNSLHKLISIDLRFDDFFENKLTLEHIEKVLKKHKELLTEEEKNLIFKYYGVNQKRVSINDLSLESNESYEVVHDRIFKLKNRILYKYYNITNGKKDDLLQDDKLLYQSYLKNPQYEFSQDTKKLLSMYLSGKKYEEISNITGLTRAKVSNIITEGLRKCEFYKYGITIPLLISEEDIQHIFEQKDYTDKEQSLIIERFLKSKTPTEVSKKYNVNTRNINALNQRFYVEYLKLKCPKIPLNKYAEELEKHPSESILTEEEKRIVALKYGIKSKYNTTGEEKSNREIALEFRITERACKSRQTHLNNKMREALLKLKQPSYGIISRCQMEKLLKNKNLPISDKERDIICHTNELYNYTYMTEENLSKKYQEKASSIKRRYNRAILAIKKYQDKSISKQLSFDTDIEPIRKYFSEYDRNLLKMYYKEGLTEEKIADKLGITKFQSRQKIMKLKLDVAEILKDEVVAKKFDFDYARQVIDKDDLPLYYDNKELIIKLYKMITGEIGTKKYTIQEAIETLQLKRSSTTISKDIYNVMLAVEKYKRGIRKIPRLSDEELSEFYKKNKQSLSAQILDIFERNKNNKIQKRKFSSLLTYEVLKKSNKNSIKVTNISKDKALKILNDKKFVLTPSCRRNIKNYYQILERDLMSGKEKIKVLKLLAPMYEKVSTNNRLQKV